EELYHIFTKIERERFRNGKAAMKYRLLSCCASEYIRLLHLFPLKQFIISSSESLIHPIRRLIKSY
ncbi:MAG: hypothetical protein PHE94_06840, partial [Eubacteriales bacterium]|nr:hypothetical protein [Eubacteriales bacterium]